MKTAGKVGGESGFILARAIAQHLFFVRLPIGDRFLSNPSNLAHAGASRAELGQAEQTPQEGGQSLLLIARQSEYRMQYPEWHKRRFQKPRSIVRNVGVFRLRRISGTRSFQDMFRRSELLQANGRYPPLQSGDDDLRVQLIVENELAHDFMLR
jgi:hypothetical protein